MGKNIKISIVFFLFGLLGLAASLFAPPARAESGATDRPAPQSPEDQRTQAESAKTATAESGATTYGQPLANQIPQERAGETQFQQMSNNMANGSDGSKAASSLSTQLTGISVALAGIGLAKETSPCKCGTPYFVASAFFAANSVGAGNAASGMNSMTNLTSTNRAALDTIDTTSLAPQGASQSTNSSTITNAPGTVRAADALAGSAGAPTSTASSGGAGLFRADDRREMIINSEALRAGELGKTFDELEKSLGLNRDDFARALANGEDAIDYLARNNKLGGRNADDLRAELAKQQADAEKLRKSYLNGEYDAFKDIVQPEAEAKTADLAGEGAGAGKVNGQASTGEKSAGARPGSNEEPKSAEQILAEIFGKREGKGGGIPLENLNPEALKDPEIRALASRGDIQLSSDYVTAPTYLERSLFERVRQRYKSATPELLTTDYFMELRFGQNPKRRR